MKKQRVARQARNKKVKLRRKTKRHQLGFSSLEPRHLLATLTWNPDFGAVTVTAAPGSNSNFRFFSNDDGDLVINTFGDEIELVGDPGNNFTLSTTGTTDNDTVTIDTENENVFAVNLSMLDGINRLRAFGDMVIVQSLNVRGGDDGNDIDLSRLSSEVADFFPDFAVTTIVSTGDGDDFVVGSIFDDQIMVGDGDNFVIGFEGNDQIISGDGFDILSGDDGDDRIDAGGGNDRLSGGLGDDVIFGRAGEDTLNGDDGDDTLVGGIDFDLIDGGDGNDVASYVDSGTSVIATIFEDMDGTGIADGFTETLVSIEGLGGSQFDDELRAFGDVDNRMFGFGGDDYIFTENGNDTIDGGDDSDTLDFAPLLSGVTAELRDAVPGPYSHQFGGGTIIFVENLIGTDRNDAFIGNNAVNRLEGGLGDDALSGRGQDDLLIGGSGNDQISGGTGDDMIIGGFGADTINGDAGDDHIVADGQVNVTFANLQQTDGALLTPIFAATQNGLYDFFNAGELASLGLQSLAEDGDATQLIAEAAASGNVGESMVTPGGVLAPGESRTLTFFASPFDTQTQYLSFASMVLPSNDAFVGNDDALAIKLFDDNGNLIRRVGDETFIVAGSEVWDAGSEVNDEIPENTAGLEQTTANTGTEEALEIATHAGHQGSNNLGGAIGNILTARPNADFTLPGANVLGINVDNVALRENGFSVEVTDQPLSSLSTNQPPINLLNEAVAGNLYFNVHTSDFPTGAIRGQLEVVSESILDGVRTIELSATLTAEQEPNNSSTSLGGGQGTMTIVSDGGVITYSSTLLISGLTSADLLPVAGFSAIHIHNAAAGINGPVITDIVQDAGGDITGDTDSGSVFEAQFETADDVIFGNDGDDLIAAGAGNDTVSGGRGNDTIYGDLGDDVLIGNGGNDMISGGEGNDRLNGGTGLDTLLGQAGDDFLIGFSGGDTVDGGEGRDFASFADINQSVTLDLFSDGTGTASYGLTSDAFSGIENLVGSNFADNITAHGNADNVIIGSGGDDLILAGSGNDTVTGDAGDDRLLGLDGEDVLIGGAGNDLLNGGPGMDNLHGGAGNDFLLGFTGTDFVDGGTGFDQNSFQGNTTGVTVVYDETGTGSAFNGSGTEFFFNVETISGSEFDDAIYANGNVGRTIFGLGGDDIIVGSDGEDVLIGGLGDDVIRGRGAYDIVFGGLGNDLIQGGDGDDFLRGDAGDDQIFGDAGDDRLVGGDGDDLLVGNAGRDYLFSGAGNDQLFGGDDDDELRGGLGDDLLAGGLGTDLLIDFEGNNTLFQ